MYLQIIQKWLSYVSEIARNNFQKNKVINVKEGDNNQVLTETDLEIGQQLIKLIKQKFPTYNIIDEESGVIDNNSEYTWVIDPIDGTSNFAMGVPTYGIIIGLLQNNLPIAGGIALPEFNKIYVAEKGLGTLCNGKKIKVTNESKLSNILLGLSIDGHQEAPDITRDESKILGELILNIRNLRSTGSVFEIGMVAENKYGGTLSKTSKVWDNVGQDIVITEAGGIYTDYFGKPMDYNQALEFPGKNYTYCASTPLLHKQIQEIIHSNLKQ